MTETTLAPNSGVGDQNRLNIAVAVLLGIAATLTAFAAYSASIQDGKALDAYTTSNAQLSDANFFYSDGNSTSASDNSLVVAYAQANFAGDTDQADYLQTLMRPELSDAVDWWNATDSAVTPFDDDPDNPYYIASYDDADAAQAAADSAYDDAVAAGNKGDDYQLAAVLFALTLFFGGISTLFRRRFLPWVLVGIGSVAAAGGLLFLLSAGS